MSVKKPTPDRRSLRRRLRMEFTSVDHLSPEAVAAFVDGELSDKAAHRARVHVVHCRECRNEVHSQRHASEAVRGSNTEACVRAPSGFVAKLANMASQQQARVMTNARVSNSVADEALDKLETLEASVRKALRRRK